MLTALVAVVTSALTALFAYLIARRQSSGSVDTSDARSIFEAEKAFREAQTAEIAELRAQITLAHTEITSLRAEITSLRSEITSLRSEAVALRQEADRLRAENAMTKSEAAILRRKIEEQNAALSFVHREMGIAKEGQ